MTELTHDNYLSPLSWRYGSAAMRAIWGEAEKRRLWRRIWVALAEAQQDAGLVTAEQVADLRAHQREVDLEQAEAIEQQIHHDLMSEVRVFAGQCELGGGIIHLGATSMDIEDNADVLRQRDALDLTLSRLRELLAVLLAAVEHLADVATMGLTHLQPAEPTTMGYRLAQYAHDLWLDLEQLQRLRGELKGKGIKGATGTSASYVQLLAGTPLDSRQLEQKVMDALGLAAMPVATQTYARKQDYLLVSALASLGQSLYKFAFDLRLLQSPQLGEWAEPFGKHQVGSSAMPFKRNPINAENICSLARLLAALPRVAWDNAAHSLLERTLDDSANRRSLLPEAFLLCDELLARGTKLIRGLQVDRDAAARMLDAYGVFAATERLLMEAVKRGGDRQQLHEVIREHSLAAWAQVKRGQHNPLADLLCADERVTEHVPAEEARPLLDASWYVGDAPRRAVELCRLIRQDLDRDTQR